MLQKLLERLYSEDITVMRVLYVVDLLVSKEDPMLLYVQLPCSVLRDL